ncbi:hypothetical protein LUX00_21075 [Streptomyces sudanensis]|nr:hypothetical protein [Streptomyces sudanensis]MCQ0002797.1 hypothetical protein [Streptomyces sudanensis]
MAAAREAVELCRGFVERHPDAFRGTLALSLNTLATQLGDHGRPREALAASREAVERYRLLAEESPRVHTADLAMSLVTHANRLRDAGHAEEALTAGREGVALYRSLPRRASEPTWRAWRSGSTASPSSFTPWTGPRRRSTRRGRRWRPAAAWHGRSRRDRPAPSSAAP